jgi:hypothetical protein
LHEKNIWQSMGNALQIKRSMGVTRGKTDRADSRIIALYALRFIDKLTIHTAGKNTASVAGIICTKRKIG